MKNDKAQLESAARQQQFLEFIDRDTATARFQQHLRLEPLGVETLPITSALNRILAAQIVSDVDVPAFNRSNVDGFAVQAADTFGAMEETPRTLILNPEVLPPGVEPQIEVRPGTATTIATGAVVPRGADAVVMVEDSEVVENSAAEVAQNSAQVRVTRSMTAGAMITFAGSDIARGETILRTGQRLTSREIGVLAAVGRDQVAVYRRPRVAVISTGDEIVAPGEVLPLGSIYDSNAAILSAAIEELGGEPIRLGTVRDNLAELQAIVDDALQYDMVVLSGGTSKGAGDLSYQVISRLADPGIVAHGVALKPGKPVCLAVTDGKPVVILPGFPTSAIFTFHEFVAPVIRALAGSGAEGRESISARIPIRINSERGRTEFLLVSLVMGRDEFIAYPMGKGSGSVTTFSCADGFITIGQHTEFLEAGETVEVQLLSRRLQPADLVVIGSHCLGLDYLLNELHGRGYSTKIMHVGSMGGLAAAKRGECDLAAIHLFDPQTSLYNRPFLTTELQLVDGYRRQQGIVFRRGDARFAGKSVSEALNNACADPQCTMVNRNAGSGTRILMDGLLADRRPPGYAIQPKSHNAVATAVVQQRADWGLAIETAAKQYGLEFLPVQDEHYDFVIPKERADKPAVREFCQLLNTPEICEHLRELGFQ